MYSSSWPCC